MTRPSAEDALEVALEQHELKPDTLIIFHISDEHIGHEDARAIADAARERLPGREIIITLGNVTTSTAIDHGRAQLLSRIRDKLNAGDIRGARKIIREALREPERTD